ncbi:MAG: hypothetical protein Alpg2KO_20440 [Alphaproteobacteria bacterium]
MKHSKVLNFLSSPVVSFMGSGLNFVRAVASFGLKLAALGVAGGALLVTSVMLGNSLDMERLHTELADAPRYERSDALYQQDLRAVSNTVRAIAADPELRTVRDAWNVLTPDARMDALHKVQSIFISQYAGYHAPQMDDEDAGLLLRHTAAGALEVDFDPETGGLDTSIDPTIWLNASYMAGQTFDKAIDTVIHETTHGIQFQMIRQLENGGAGLSADLRQDAASFRHGGNTYPIPLFQLADYYMNSLEEHANSNGRCSAYALQAALGRPAHVQTDKDEKAMAAGEATPVADPMLELTRAVSGPLETPVTATVKACFDEHKAGFKLRPDISDEKSDKGLIEISAEDVETADRALNRKNDAQGPKGTTFKGM